jgi:hypothetical protein
MDVSKRQEQFGNAYIRAVAAVAGFTLYIPEVDDDSVDLGLAASGPYGTFRSPRLEMQVKCPWRFAADGNAIHYAIKVKNYDDLRPELVMVPRILVIICIPEEPDDWLHHCEEQLSLRKCAYWVSLRGRPELPNETQVTIGLPRSQQLNVESLRSMMERIGAGKMP